MPGSSSQKEENLTQGIRRNEEKETSYPLP